MIEKSNQEQVIQVQATTEHVGPVVRSESEYERAMRETLNTLSAARRALELLDECAELEGRDTTEIKKALVTVQYAEDRMIQS